MRIESTAPASLPKIAASTAPAARRAVATDAFVGPSSATGGDPNAAALVGLRRGLAGGSYAPLIRQLQDDLVRAGCLDASITSNAGYGNTFGPLTEAALRKFQGQANVPVTGVVDAATAQALSGNAAPPPPAPGPTDPLVGLHRGLSGAQYAPAIKALQDDLVRLGYVDASFQRDSGYGNTFGPKTEAALEQLQLENGLPATGAVDAATSAALSNPRPRPAGLAAGAWSLYKADLGLATAAPTVAADGTFTQTFDHGSVVVGSDHVRHVLRSDGTDLVPPSRLGTVGTLDEANQVFLTQWGPTAYNSAAGAPFGYSDCGPTSSVMALSALGLVPHPDPAGAEAAISAQRDADMGYHTSTSLEMGFYSVGKGLAARGAVTDMVSGLPGIDAALGRGNPVIVGGDPWKPWGYAASVAGNYLNHRDPGGHFVAVLGKTVDGNYIVGDPLMKTGAIAVTASQLSQFMGTSFGAMEVALPS